MFVAVGSIVDVKGTQQVMTSTDDGITWTGHLSPNGENKWTSVTYGMANDIDMNGQLQNFVTGAFIAVAYRGTNRIMVSYDGASWLGYKSVYGNATVLESNMWTSITYGCGKFVVVAEGGINRTMSSTDGYTWIRGSSLAADIDKNGWQSVTYGNGMFLSVASAGSNRVMRSTNGINWNLYKSSDETNLWKSVTYGNGMFVAVAAYQPYFCPPIIICFQLTNHSMWSTDGIMWTGQPVANDDKNGWQSVTYGNGMFVAVANKRAMNRTMSHPDSF